MFLNNHSSAFLLHDIRVVKNVACLSSLIFRFELIKSSQKHAVITNSYNTILNDYTWIKPKQSNNICVLLTWQLSWPTSRQKL